MRAWLWLAAVSLGAGFAFACWLALAMISKGGSHVMYCPNLPAGHILPCMPSATGIAAALLVTVVAAVPVFAMGAPIALAFSGRRERGPDDREHRS